jgi:hypothetical protein
MCTALSLIRPHRCISFHCAPLQIVANPHTCSSIPGPDGWPQPGAQQASTARAGAHLLLFMASLSRKKNIKFTGLKIYNL